MDDTKLCSLLGSFATVELIVQEATLKSSVFKAAGAINKTAPPPTLTSITAYNPGSPIKSPCFSCV